MRILAVLIILVGMEFTFCPPYALAQSVPTDEVSITSGDGQLFGITAGEGITRQLLAAGEGILVVETKGVTGFVQTTKRLLGFSGRLQRWVEMNLSSAETIAGWKITPRMIVVQGHGAVYGFQSDASRWKKESLGAGESVVSRTIDDHVGVLITNRRALGFSAFTGGFFSQDLPSGNSIHRVQVNDNVVIIHLSDLTLIFRSRLALWTALPD